MGHLDTGPGLKEYPPSMIYQLLKWIEESVNNMDDSNFQNYILSPKKINWREYIVFTVSAVPVYTTTNTTGINIGPYFAWDPAKFPGGSWYIEGSIAVANVAAAAILTLKGAADVGSVQTSDIALKRVRSLSPLTMPSTAQNIWFVIKSNNASYAASFAGAHLIYVP